MNYGAKKLPNWAEILFPLHTTVYKKIIQKMKCCNSAQSGLRPEFKNLAPRSKKFAILRQDLCFGGVVHLGKTCEPGRWAPRGSCEPGRWAPRTNKSQIPVNVKTTVFGLLVYQLVTLMHQTISIVKWLLLLTNLPLNVQQANPLRTPFLPDGWKWPRRSLQ